MTTNNVIRMLTSKKISFQIFELPKEKLGAQRTAQILNIPIEIVCKTIVVKRTTPGKHILAVLPGNRSVNLKLISAALNEKKLIIPTEKEAEQLTGLQSGGISPLALINKGFQVLIDSSIINQKEVHVSAGQRGLNIRIHLDNLVSLTNAKFFPISSETDISMDN